MAFLQSRSRFTDSHSNDLIRFSTATSTSLVLSPAIQTHVSILDHASSVHRLKCIKVTHVYSIVENHHIDSNPSESLDSLHSCGFSSHLEHTNHPPRLLFVPQPLLQEPLQVVPELLSAQHSPPARLSRLARLALFVGLAVLRGRGLLQPSHDVVRVDARGRFDGGVLAAGAGRGDCGGDGGFDGVVEVDGLGGRGGVRGATHHHHAEFGGGGRRGVVGR